MRLLVFKHIECEHPGSLRKFLAEDGIEWLWPRKSKRKKYQNQANA